MNGLKKYLKLCRISISFFAACSAATGFILAPSSRGSYELALTFTAVFLLGCGASALNQWQEREYDGRMERTRCRPLPSGNMSPSSAVISSAMLIVSGLFILMLRGGSAPAVLGIAALIWYNGLYTYLKKKTAFAAVPGAFVGAIPPLIGWASAGGPIPDPRIIAVSSFFLLWQVPHFWLKMLEHGDDYIKAGFPSITEIFSKDQAARITFVWLASAASSSVMLPLYDIAASAAAFSALFSLACWIVWKGRALIRTSAPELLSRRVFRSVNSYVMLVMLCVSFDRIL